MSVDLAASSDVAPGITSSRRWWLYVFVGGLTAAVLLYTVAEQLFDTNFYVLWEATAVLGGDHPYRDFYQTGWPLVTGLSTLAQWLTGQRLIGEFLIHWSFIIAGILIGFHISLRLSRSVPASLATVLVALVMLASSGTFHFPKLFVYPFASLVMWRYLEMPHPTRAAIVGAATAVAFLFRHDHGIYVGVASLFTLALARVAVPASRTARSIVNDTLAYAAAAATMLAPWALVVQMNEGLVDYARTRLAWGGQWAPPGSVYKTFSQINPLGVLEWPDANSWRPSDKHGLRWLMHITALIPLMMLVSTACDVIALRRQRRSVTPDVCATMLAAGLVILVVHRLVREAGYFVVVLPLTAAFGARLLAGSPLAAARALASQSLIWGKRTWRAARLTIAVGALLTTAVAAVGHLDWDLLSRNELDELVVTYRHLLSSPAIDVYQPADEARETDAASWKERNADARQRVIIRYMHECTRPGDRVFVTGSTPYHVGYYVQRPIAGGHLQWHHGWRSDAIHERQSLELLKNQSVPFAYSTNDPVLDDLRAYPGIRAYLEEQYVEIDGTGGRLLVDTRRQPTGTFGALGFPCFR